MWFNNGNNSCLWIILIIILLCCCCGDFDNDCRRDRDCRDRNESCC